MDDTTVNMDAYPGDVPGGSIEKSENLVRRFFLAGIGAAAVAYDVAEDTFDRFARRGAEVQREALERAQEARTRNRGASTRVGESLRTGMDVVLNNLNLPSKTDVDTVNVKLNILTRKIDDLQMRNDVADTVTETEIILPTEEAT